jgi:neuromedin U receptor 1
VVILFFLCWFPFHIQRLLTVFLNDSHNEQQISRDENDALVSPSTAQSIFNVIFYISGYCYYANSCVNPILYNLLSHKYRLAFCNAFHQLGALTGL